MVTIYNSVNKSYFFKDPNINCHLIELTNVCTFKNNLVILIKQFADITKLTRDTESSTLTSLSFLLPFSCNYLYVAGLDTIIITTFFALKAVNYVNPECLCLVYTEFILQFWFTVQRVIALLYRW